MKILAEALAFTGMAVALHLGGLALATGGAGAPDAQGAGGADLVALRGADGALTGTVADWTRAPLAQDRAAPNMAPPTPDHPPAATSATDTPPAEVTAALTLPEALAPLLPRQPARVPRPDVVLLSVGLARALVPEGPALVPGADDSGRKVARAPARPAAPDEANALPTVSPVTEPPMKRTLPRRSAAPALRAAGHGGGEAAGVSGRADTPSLSPGDSNSLLAAWGARIRGAVERHKHYPRAAGGATGTATVEISVIGDGRVQRAALRQSAGHPALDHAALAAVRAAGQFSAAPEGLGPGPHDFSFQMSFDR